ncbi:UDP-glucuronosyltransferase [Aphelenchoides fujianensis]|nr:UDP-glucuronosyltransferase [Aphelenchoides fujianensis]
MAALRFFFLLLLGLHEFSAGLRVLIVAPNVSFSHLSFAGRFADLLVETGHQVDFLIPEWNRFVRGNGTEKAAVRRVALRNVDELEAALKGMAMLNDVFRAEITAQTRIEYGRIDSIYCEAILNVHQHTPVGSLWERAFNLLTWLQLHFHTLPRQFAAVDATTRRLLGPDFPSTAQLLREVDFFWLNSNQFVDAPRPLSARFKHVGGIAVRPPGQLSPEIEELMREKEGNEGVVLVSFGSIVRTSEMPPEVRESFVRAFAALSQFMFIWKLSAPAAFRRSLSPNVHVVEWMNQTAILGPCTANLRPAFAA